MIKVFFIFLAISLAVSAQQRMVVVELFTNSHCTVCPAAHSALKSYIQNEPNGKYIVSVYYHDRKYPDDQLYIASMTDSDARNAFYGTLPSSPVAIFNGAVQNNSFSQWKSRLDAEAAMAGSFEISLSGAISGNSVDVHAEVKQSADVSAADHTINFVLVENDVGYSGRNGITSHEYVMRKIITPPNGEGFSISNGETKVVSKTFELNSSWKVQDLIIVVFIQSTSSKTIFQTEGEYISSLPVTSVDNENTFPSEFILFQNYPNPFNPSTTLSFVIGNSSFVNLSVYDILGNKVSELVNEERTAGEYSIEFDGKELSSGVYFYKITAVPKGRQTEMFTSSGKMILVK